MAPAVVPAPPGAIHGPCRHIHGPCRHGERGTRTGQQALQSGRPGADVPELRFLSVRPWHRDGVAKTQYYTATSIDGYTADLDNSLDWLFEVDEGTDNPFGAFFSG